MGRQVDVAVIGAGQAGLNALEEVRKITGNYCLINDGGLGAICTRSGRSPQAASRLTQIYARRRALDRYGSDDAAPCGQAAVLRQIRGPRDRLVNLLPADIAAALGDALIEGHARFIGPTTLRAGGQTIEAGAVVIATGARTCVPPDWRERLGERILTVEALFEQEHLPESAAVIGLGPIGVEMSQVLHRLGVRVIGIESGATVARLEDPVVSQAVVESLGGEFPVWLGAPAQVEPQGAQVLVRAGPHQAVVERVFVAMGRYPNLDDLGLRQTGCALDGKK